MGMLRAEQEAEVRAIAAAKDEELARGVAAADKRHADLQAEHESELADLRAELDRRVADLQHTMTQVHKCPRAWLAHRTTRALFSSAGLVALSQRLRSWPRCGRTPSSNLRDCLGPWAAAQMEEQASAALSSQETMKDEELAKTRAELTAALQEANADRAQALSECEAKVAALVAEHEAAAAALLTEKNARIEALERELAEAQADAKQQIETLQVSV